MFSFFNTSPPFCLCDEEVHYGICVDAVMSGEGRVRGLPFGYFSLANEPAALVLTQSVKNCNLYFC